MTALHPSMIQRCPRGSRFDARTITAPEPPLRLDFTDEAVRLDYFAQSASRFPLPAPVLPPSPQGWRRFFSFVKDSM